MWNQLSVTSYTKVEGGRDKQVGWQSNDLKDKWDSKQIPRAITLIKMVQQKFKMFVVVGN